MARRNKRTQDEPRELTRKQIHQSARERERNRRILIGAGIAIGLALLMVVAGVLNEFVVKPRSTLAVVGSDKIVTREFWKRVYLQQNELQNQFVRLTNLERQFGNQGFFASQIAQIEATLSSPFSLGVQVLDEMINEEVMREEAAARGIVVSDEEVDQALLEQIAASQNAVTVPQATETAESAVVSTATAEAWTPTPTATIDLTSTITATATPIPTAEPAPTRPVLTDASYDEGLSELETSLRDMAGMSLVEYREVLRSRMLAEKMREAIGVEQVASTEEQRHARHILLQVRDPEPSPTPEGFPTPEPSPTPTPLPEGFPAPEPTPSARSDAETLALAQDLRQRLLDGEDFAALAEEFSDDPGSGLNGGDLGWFGLGAMVPVFEEATFSLEIGEISEPIKSDFGYHIIEVLENDPNRLKDENAVAQEQIQAYEEWLRQQVAAVTIERPDDIVSKLPSDLEPTTVQLPVQQ